ncbi:MAG: hypothetical protein ACM3ZS_11690 [Nitrososphaerota archaeon]
MGDVPNPYNNTDLKNTLHLLIHEYCHHWSVPETGIRFNDSQFWPSPPGACTFGLEDGVSVALHRGSYFDSPLMLGREHSHWSAYFQGGASPMDAVNWDDVGLENGYSIWRQTPLPQLPSLNPTGLDPIQLDWRFNDLDLVIIGAKSRNEAYTPTGFFKWMEPRLTAPLDYFAGIFIAFSITDFLYFGFYASHKQLGLQQTGGIPNLFNLLNYEPLRSENNNVALRVVRRDNDYYFQAKFDSPNTGVTGSRLLGDIDRDLRQLVPPTESLSPDRFRTLFRRSLPGTSRPKALGLMVKTWDKALMCDAVFLNFELKDGSSNPRVLRTNLMPTLWNYSSSSSYDSEVVNLPTDRFSFHRPVEGPYIRIDGSRIHIIAPYKFARRQGNEWPLDDDVQLITVNEPFDHGPVDKAPKLITKSPPANFAIATSARIHRSAFTPWAWGYANGKTMWGRVKSASIQSVEFDQTIQSKQTDPAISPSDQSFTYKNAFIVMARERSEFLTTAGKEKIDYIDKIRRYWDDAFSAITLGRRRSNSILGT